MTESDVDPFTERLSALAAIYRVELHPGVIRAYFHALADLPMPLVADAMNDATREAIHFPRPAELRIRARDLRRTRYLASLPAPEDRPMIPPHLSRLIRPLAMPAGPAPPRRLISSKSADAPARRPRRRMTPESFEQSRARLRQQARQLGVTPDDVAAALAAADAETK